MLPRLLLVIAVAGLVAQAVTAAPSRPAAPERTVPCDEVIDRTTFPFVGSASPGNRYRPVLGVFSVPPAYLAQVVPTESRPWAYWRKSGLVVRAGSGPVSVSVPMAWRNRAAIQWGNGGNGGPFSVVRFEPCGDDVSVGNAYAGGFLLRSRSACVPLVFRSGARSATVRFGVGRRCAS